MPETMISVERALGRIQKHVSACSEAAERSVRDALNHVLAREVAARHDIPRFDNSAMDGYVLRKRDLDDGQASFPVAFEIRPEDDEVPAIEPGTCARIMTGARIPPHGDQVIPVEMVEESDDRIQVRDVPGRNPIRPRGEGYAEGQVLLRPDTVIRPYEVGLMIEAGHVRCTIKKPIHIALQVTGSEIDEENDTNGPVLEELLSSWPGTRVQTWPVLGDDPERVEQRLLDLKESADVIVTTGGISAGKHDYLFQTMERLGARCLIRKVAQKPGKPFTFSLWDDIPVCHLPGNPVSAVFTAECYARQVVAQMLGLKPRTIHATTDDALDNHRQKTLFVTARVYEQDGKLRLQARDRMRSHLLQTYTGENAYALIPPETRYEPSDLVACIPFSTERWLEA